MNNPSVLKEKSFRFALMILGICRFLKETHIEFTLQRQLHKSGTAIGALIAEAEFAQSKADFTSKLSIALKEANETRYWLDLLCESQCIPKQSIVEANLLLTELIKMLIASLKTAKCDRSPK
jgi:four helix bundle protein